MAEKGESMLSEHLWAQHLHVSLEFAGALEVLKMKLSTSMKKDG